MTADAKDALAVWDALKPKIEQLIDEKTHSAVRRKKMNITSINTTNRTVTVYEGVNSSRNITVPYRPGSGVDQLDTGNSVLVEWISDDISTAVAVAQGQGWASAMGTMPGAVLPGATISNSVLTGNIDVSGANVNYFGDVLYTNSSPTQGMASNTALVSNLDVTMRAYNLFLFEFCYSTDYTNIRNSVTAYIPSGSVPDLYVHGAVPWYDSNGVLAAWREIRVYQTTSGTDTYWNMTAQAGYLATTTGNANYTKYCIPIRIIGMHI